MRNHFNHILCLPWCVNYMYVWVQCIFKLWIAFIFVYWWQT